ncbi:uncharacterized protein TRUGW13939_08895 [Talaromyces rugulosus]|uniref:Uncharacterized protein n=1 Tax=Talaromyces rugulosus TaxID=121627 RepID=A0A7H8R5S6_TALRU|nr:uncharacterized protein TRUGW13939_08895 [Talaromyces rugulosus]QKX61739.1 hypothetical protein TRUGW13939_08895 [Talaromyces rugulosus]
MQEKAISSSNGVEQWTAIQKALNKIIVTYGLNGDDAYHPCLKPIDLSWQLPTTCSTSDLSKRDTCNYDRIFEVYQEVPENETEPGYQDTYWAGFDLSLKQGDNADYLCDSGYQVVGPVPWHKIDTPIPGSLGPLDLNQGKYTGCKYNRGDVTGNGTLTCNGISGTAS